MRAAWGMIHGRFQPFHNGHLEYLRRARQRCERIIVGITNPDPSAVVAETASTHRHEPESNPFTFFQRALMVRDVLRAEQVPADSCLVIPFPIHHPERWPFYVPREVVQLVWVFSAWEEEKVRRLRAAGYRVEVVASGLPKDLSASEVRRRIRSGEDWRALVPPAVASVVEAVLAGKL